MQPDVFADAVVVMVKNALAPVLADVKTLQAQVAGWESRWNDVATLRERVAVIESAVEADEPLPQIIPPDPEPVDLSPVLERLAASEARLSVLGDLRDRVVTIEAKAAQPAVVPTPEPPPVVDLSPALERIAAAEARLDVLGDLRDRVVIVETKAQHPMPVDFSNVVTPVELGEVRARVSAMESELRLAIKTGELQPVLEKYEALGVEVNGLRERLAVAEMRQLVPGPPGRDGLRGEDGRDGADALGWDDLAVEQIDERTFSIKCMRGLQIKEIGRLTFPVEIYRGVYLDGKTYDRGDGVTWAGSEWHCNETTNSKPGDGSKAWTLKVKRGRDGKDFTPVPSMPAPVVSVGKR